MRTHPRSRARHRTRRQARDGSAAAAHEVVGCCGACCGDVCVLISREARAGGGDLMHSRYQICECASASASASACAVRGNHSPTPQQAYWQAHRQPTALPLRIRRGSECSTVRSLAAPVGAGAQPSLSKSATAGTIFLAVAMLCGLVLNSKLRAAPSRAV